MRVVDRLAGREQNWRELDALLHHLGQQGLRSADAEKILRLGELYRAACADLMLADAYDLPADTVAYLHTLVGRAHNAVYRSEGFRFQDFADAVLHEAPRRLRKDPALRIAAAVFYGVFLVFAMLSAGRPGFAQQVIGEGQIAVMENMYDQPISSVSGQGMRRNDAAMAGFYILNNTSIGLQCFAWGLVFGVGSLFVLISNAVTLGTVFGYMATVPQAVNFYTFVTAHGPFELTAVVFSAAAGLRLGYGLIDTQGETRIASLQREARLALPTVGAAVLLFILAAFLEGFVSAAPIPYSTKAIIALLSASILIAYLAFGGRRGAARTPEVDPARSVQARS